MFHRKSSKTTRPNSSVRFFDLSPRQGPLVGIHRKLSILWNELVESGDENRLGKCERCGFRRWRLSRTRCMVCGAALCENCQMVAGYANDHVTGSVRSSESTWPRVPNVSPYHTVCSWESFDRWAWTFISRGHAPAVLGQQYVLGGIRLHPGTAGRTVALAEDFRRTQKLAQVRNLTEAEDHESAAGIYQELGMWKEAGEVRRIGRRQLVTQVHVNVNDLVDQVRKAGIATDYTCPTCGGHIHITGETLATLRNCQHCGSVVQTTDLVDFLIKVVGYQ